MSGKSAPDIAWSDELCDALLSDDVYCAGLRVGSTSLGLDDPHDLDSVVCLSSLPSHLAREIQDHAGDALFTSIKIRRNGIPYDIIVVSDEEFKAWEFAQELTLHFCKTQAVSLKKMANKDFRVGFFEACKLIYRKSFAKANA
jgi:hypothetical protein